MITAWEWLDNPFLTGSANALRERRQAGLALWLIDKLFRPSTMGNFGIM